MDEFSKFKLDKMLLTLQNLGKCNTCLPKGLWDHLDEALHVIAQNVVAYYEDQYDEYEPSVANFNTEQLIVDLIKVSEGSAEVKIID